jgi:hypothetical protein
MKNKVVTHNYRHGVFANNPVALKVKERTFNNRIEYLNIIGKNKDNLFRHRKETYDHTVNRQPT